MHISDFDFDLPPGLIAQHPLPDRAASRLLVLDKNTGEINHHRFPDLMCFLRAGDCLVLNDTRVLPARLMGRKVGGGAVVEFVLLKPLANPLEWEVLARPGKRLHIGTQVEFGQGELVAEILGNTEAGGKVVRFSLDGDLYTLLDRLGQMPLPPYIRSELTDKERYQTVYSRSVGSAAAPTAGLHFTPELLAEIRAAGIRTAFLTLHVGLGTFRPVQVDDIADHKMHNEYYELSVEAADEINAASASGGRIIAVGTTSSRTLETVANEAGHVTASSGWTDIFIYPGYNFKLIDGLVTNFHLPKSTLLMLVDRKSTRLNSSHH